MISTRLSPIAVAAAVLTLLHSPVLADLGKPVINPPIEFSKIDQGLLTYLKPAPSTVDVWGPGWIPQDCKTNTESSGFKAIDIEVFNVHYADCCDPWIMCRHKESPMSKTDLIDLFGRLPVRMRSYLRHLIALPGVKSASSSGDNTVFFGPANVISIFAHEVGHSLDSHAYPPNVTPFHESTPWLDAFKKDSSISDPYAGTSQAENVAQETVISLFDKVVPGGIKTIEPNWQAISNQYTTLQTYIGNTIIPGGVCTNRLENSPPVPMAPAVRGRVRVRLPISPMPDVSLSDGINVIPPTPIERRTIETCQLGFLL
ncbi:MAG: hypothetical protein M1839_003032 [Geoglossum umbratile]|nr:MAG: hypothetical protein M1839_003032 [Geoglossum umbratile]